MPLDSERGFLKWDTYNSFKLHERGESLLQGSVDRC